MLRQQLFRYPICGLAEFFTSGGEMKTIWRVLMVAALDTILSRQCIREVL